MTSDQLIEFARGLANSGKTFLWVIRPDLVDGENMVLPYELCQRLKIEVCCQVGIQPLRVCAMECQ